MNIKSILLVFMLASLATACHQNEHEHEHDHADQAAYHKADLQHEITHVYNEA